jgi:hypothetical protein
MSWLSFVSIVGFGALLATAAGVICWQKGSQPERAGIILYLACWLLVTVTQMITGSNLSPTVMMLFDLLLGGGFLVIAMRYVTIWVAFAMLLEAAQLMVFVYFPSDSRSDRYYHALTNNILSTAVLLVMILGAFLSRPPRPPEDRRDDPRPGLARLFRTLIIPA